MGQVPAGEEVVEPQLPAPPQGGGTGSAQVGTEIANGVFVAYAPYEDPEIAVAIVIEKGGAGAALASTAVEIINAYFADRVNGGDVVGENTMLK